MAERGTFRAARPLMPPLETRTGEPKCCIAQTLPSHPPACHESERHACSLSHIPRWGPTVGSRWQHASSSFLRVPCRLMLSLGLSSGSGFAMIPWSRVPIAERRPSASWFLISVICRCSPSRTDETAHEPLSLGPLNPRLWLCRAISTSMGKNFLLTDRARWRRSSTTKKRAKPRRAQRDGGELHDSFGEASVHVDSSSGSVAWCGCVGSPDLGHWSSLGSFEHVEIGKLPRTRPSRHLPGT